MGQRGAAPQGCPVSIDAMALAQTIVGLHRRVACISMLYGRRHERLFCDSDEHDGASGGPWPCDAIRLARLVLGDAAAGGPDDLTENERGTASPAEGEYVFP